MPLVLVKNIYIPYLPIPESFGFNILSPPQTCPSCPPIRITFHILLLALIITHISPILNLIQSILIPMPILLTINIFILPLYLCIYPLLPLPIPFSMILYLSLSIHLPTTLTLLVPNPLPLTLSLTLSLSLFLPLYLPLPLTTSITLSLPLTMYINLKIPLPLFQYHPITLLIEVFLTNIIRLYTSYLTVQVFSFLVTLTGLLPDEYWTMLYQLRYRTSWCITGIDWMALSGICFHLGGLMHASLT